MSKKFRAGGNELVFDFWPISRILNPERNNRNSRFLAVDFCQFSRDLHQQGMNLFPDFKLFLGILKQGRSEVIARFLAIFTNLRPERNELNYCSIFAILLNLRPERSARISRFSPIATNLSRSKNCRAQAINHHCTML